MKTIKVLDIYGNERIMEVKEDKNLLTSEQAQDLCQEFGKKFDELQISQLEILELALERTNELLERTCGASRNYVKSKGKTRKSHLEKIFLYVNQKKSLEQLIEKEKNGGK